MKTLFLVITVLFATLLSVDLVRGQSSKIQSPFLRETIGSTSTTDKGKNGDCDDLLRAVCKAQNNDYEKCRDAKVAWVSAACTERKDATSVSTDNSGQWVSSIGAMDELTDDSSLRALVEAQYPAAELKAVYRVSAHNVDGYLLMIEKDGKPKLLWSSATGNLRQLIFRRNQ